jgi:hypothetical protein
MSSITPRSATTDCPLPTAVVAHDAGATNLLIAWLKAWGWSVRACVQGPARKLWAQAFPGEPIWDTPAQAMAGCASLVTGTGWASALEHDARREGRAQGLHVAAVIDHWVNYAARFERDGKTVWPDEVWVADAWAAETARQALPPMPIRQFENLYLQAQVAQVAPPPGDGTLLYVLEPVRDDWGRGKEGEFQALEYLLAHRDTLASGSVRRILLRPHPSDPEGKYARYLDAHADISLDHSPDMATALSQADVVVGVESFALTLAVAAGRAVYSSLPPWAPALRLPQECIRQIRRLSPT